MGGTLRLVLGDQLSTTLSALRGGDTANDTVLMAEVAEEASYVPHHKKKLAFVFAAMRHHAAVLSGHGWRVIYHALDDHEPASSLTDALNRAIHSVKPERIVVTEPGEWRVLEMMRDWRETLDIPLDIRADDRFIASHADFAAWAKDGRKTLRMEYFYREMRKRTGYLMEADEPVGGAWNHDASNRKLLPADLAIPTRPQFPANATTRVVIAMVAERFAGNFGSLGGFDHPVTRDDAVTYLDWFIENALPLFGDYQDAMREGEPLLFHSHLSALINIGLLDPRECCERAIAAFDRNLAPINAVEGFVRQIIGWREFIRGVYWLKMPGYGEENALDAHRPLPGFFWTAETPMACMAAAIRQTHDHAYAHHIQRLMVIGNFALLAGLDPAEVQRWFLLVYHDAYEWAEMPNVVGMALYADGGLFASKPYAASGAYIDRMSDHCCGCRYDVKEKTGTNACPFNTLYWDFIARNRKRLSGNPRMGVVYKSLDRMDPGRVEQIRADAARFLDELAVT